MSLSSQAIDRLRAHLGLGQTESADRVVEVAIERLGAPGRAATEGKSEPPRRTVPRQLGEDAE